MTRAARSCLIALVSIPLFLLGTCHLIVGPVYYRATPLTATVVDEETGKPVPDAFVVAHWVLEPWPEIGIMQTFHIFETTTGPDGSFHVPGWGPKLRWPFYHLNDGDPEIMVYKPGYLATTATNSPVQWGPVVLEGPGSFEAMKEYERLGIKRGYLGEYSRSVVRRSFWNGKIIALAPADTVEHEREALSYFRSTIDQSGRRLKAYALTQKRQDELEKLYRERRDQNAQ